MPTYVQPIAQHLVYPERLLLRAEDDRAYVWLGEHANATPEEIDPRTAAWLQTNPWIRPLPQPRVWLHIADLPVTTVGSRQ